MIERPRIAARLLASIGCCKLLLLRAPAGYGKTVALVQLLQKLPAPSAVAWVSAQPGDDLQRVLACLLAALEPCGLSWRISPQVLPELSSSGEGIYAAAMEVANALATARVERGVIVVDDVHHIDDARVSTFLDALLADIPSHWTLAMASRCSPSLALGRLRMSGWLREFRQADLRFTDDEADTLFKASPVECHDAIEWHKNVRGWPAGLAVGLMVSGRPSRMGRASTAAKRRLFEYMAQEVLLELPPALQLFLLRCAVLPELSEERCRHVSGDLRAARWLEDIEQRDLFVATPDAENLTLRLHDLFRDFLLHRLQRDMPGEYPELLTRAAATEPDVPTRVALLRRAGETQAALQQLLDNVLSMIVAGAGDQMERVVDSFPAAMQRESPELAFVRGLCAWRRWSFVTTLAEMRKAMAGFERSGQVQLAIQARAVAVIVARSPEALSIFEQRPLARMEPDTELLWRLASVTLTCYRGCQGHPAADWDRAIDLMSTNPDTVRWMSLHQMTFVYLGQPGLARAMDRLIDLLRACGESSPALQERYLTMRAWRALWKADLATAIAVGKEAEAAAHWLSNPPAAVVPLRMLRALSAQLMGQPQTAYAELNCLHKDARRSPARRAALLYSSMQGLLCTVNGDAVGAQAALQFALDHKDLCVWTFAQISTGVLRADALRREGRKDEALHQLREVGPLAVSGAWWGLQGLVSVAWALAELRAGNVRRAWQALSPALSAALDADEVLGLLLSGAEALETLACAQWPDEASTRQLALLDRCAAQARAGFGGLAFGADVQEVDAVGDVNLSGREIQVLRLISQGQSNKHIARALNLSPHTVKRHVSRILVKTGRNSRGQAAAWLDLAQDAIR